MWWLSLIACSGGPVDPGPDAPHPLPELPATFSVVPEAAGPVLKAGARTCKAGDERFTWRPDLSFEASTPKARFAGTYRVVDEAIVHLTQGPIGHRARCSHARFLGDVLLCAEGPLGSEWAVEIVDDGAGAEATALVAQVVGALPGGGVVFQPASSTPGHGGGVQVTWRKPPDQLRIVRERAEQAAALIERDLQTSGVSVTEDPEATSPIVIRVGGTVSR